MTDSEQTGQQRHAWATEHAKHLEKLLESKPPRETPQRIFRTRMWLDGVYTVVTMVQNLNLTPQPNQPDIKVHLFVTRSFEKASMGATVLNMQLAGQYSYDEIVAFLALDKLNPTSLEWVDETKYSSIVVVGDILRKIH